MKKPLLLFTMGFPGAGKSTFASQLCKAIGATYVGADTIAHELFPFPKFNETERQQVFQEMGYRVEDSLAGGIPAIYDSNANTQERRQRIYQLAERYKVECVGIWITMPTDTARRRALLPRAVQYTKQLHRITEQQFDAALAVFEMPSSSEPVIQIKGNVTFTEQLRNYRAQAAFRAQASDTKKPQPRQ